MQKLFICIQSEVIFNNKKLFRKYRVSFKLNILKYTICTAQCMRKISTKVNQKYSEWRDATNVFGIILLNEQIEKI